MCVLNSSIVTINDHFNFAEIRFCPFQIMFLLYHRDTLECGQWPPECKESIGNRCVVAEGRHVKPAVILAELNVRLGMTDRRGEMLVTQIDDGRSFHTLSDGAREALFYVKGFRRKKVGFKRWLREVYYAQKTGVFYQ